MILISHRGNITQPNPNLENTPDYIQAALKEGYDCEIDVWFLNGSFWLGHDFGVYKIDKSFLINSHLWCHAKNIDALKEMTKNRMIHCFWHQTDDFTLTSQNFIWCYPGKEIPSSNSIVLMTEKHPRLSNAPLTGYAGVCSDYINLFK
jgi:hypothetical protein